MLINKEKYLAIVEALEEVTYGHDCWGSYESYPPSTLETDAATAIKELIAELEGLL